MLLCFPQLLSDNDLLGAYYSFRITIKTDTSCLVFLAGGEAGGSLCYHRGRGEGRRCSSKSLAAPKAQPAYLSRRSPRQVSTLSGLICPGGHLGFHAQPAHLFRRSPRQASALVCWHVQASHRNGAAGEES